MRRAFIVIVDYDGEPESGPVIGDIHWALLNQQSNRWPGNAWRVHTTDLTAEMLAHHGLPDPPVGGAT